MAGVIVTGYGKEKSRMFLELAIKMM